MRRTGFCLVVSFLIGCATAPEPTPQAPAYEPSWESLTTHDVPEWLLDAKFGLYAHWGVYSVPAFGNEWYAKEMYDPHGNRGIFKHHQDTYGGAAKFGYKEFIKDFKAENFDPDQWADLIAKSGAKYAGIATVHHDGFLLWDSEVSRWNAADMGPKRDLYGELITAIRAKGLKTIATFHHIRTFDWWLPRSDEDIEAARAANYDLFDPEYADFYWNRYTGNYKDFMAQWKAKVREVTDKYQPDVVWFDGGKFQEDGSEREVLEILSYYYNQSRAWGKPVDVLNKLPSTRKFNFPENFGVLTFEGGRDRPEVVERPWIDDLSLGLGSWGYTEKLKYRPINYLIDGLVDRVARNGGLLISLAPKADGTLPDEQVEQLLGIGKWLEVNGEAIFGTRPWKIQAEGPHEKFLREGNGHTHWTFDVGDAADIRFTKKSNTLYATALGWPDDGKLVIKSLSNQTDLGGPILSITLLGGNGVIEWAQDDEALTVSLPQEKPNEYAYALKINIQGTLAD